MLCAVVLTSFSGKRLLFSSLVGISPPHAHLSAPKTVRRPPKRRSAVRTGGRHMPARRQQAQWPRCGAKLAAQAVKGREEGEKEK
eukprot:11571040-Alexandrium_andersonii.AAC.1